MQRVASIRHVAVHGFRKTWLISAAVAVVAGLGAGPAYAVQHAQSTVVNAVPASGTPNINDGIVYAIAKTAGRIFLGGTFMSASPASDDTTVDTQPYAMAFDDTSYDIDTGFAPTINGRVNTIIPGPGADEVYLGGDFDTVDGKPMHVALLNTDTGQLVAGWRPSAINGQVYTLNLSNGRLFVGGTFTRVGSKTRDGLATLNPTTGRRTSYADLSFTGHHNYNRRCDPSTETCALGQQGVRSFDISPDGNELVAIGNFIKVSGTDRDQVAVIDLGKKSATLDSRWKTESYTAKCFANADDSYPRDIQFSPDGSYFVIVSTGGIGTNKDGTKGQCDSAARYNTAASGKNVRPTWVDYTGEDTIWSVSITGTAIYIGGHERWLNNSLGLNVAAAGAVPRPGVAALSPTSGLPLSWDPGRNPRGGGAYALLATGNGVWLGSDTDYIGNSQYLRKKLAFFPLAGGETLPADATPKLPGRIFLVGDTSTNASDPDRLAAVESNGRQFGTPEDVSSPVQWGDVRGAFTVNGELVYGLADGSMNELSFDGSTVGSDVVLDPYDDPRWDNVQTGSGQTYRGVPSNFTTQLPNVTSMFFKADKLYFTVEGDNELHWRWFEPDDGIVGADDHTIASGPWANIAGAVLEKKTLYYADATTGDLMSLKWSGGAPAGKAHLADDSMNWDSRGLFALSESTNPTTTPVGSFTTSCVGAKCTFRATPWTDPDGGKPTYRWKFGDGSSKGPAAKTTVSHSYKANRKFKVTLTVKTTSSASSSVSHHVKIR